MRGIEMKAWICHKKTDGTDVLEVLEKLSTTDLDKTLDACVRWQCMQSGLSASEEDIKKIFVMMQCVRGYYIEATVNQMLTFCERNNFKGLWWGTIEMVCD